MSVAEKRHKNFAEALSLAVEILPIQLHITQLVRQMTEDERSLFQSMLNQHPAMLDELRDKAIREKEEMSREEIEEIENKKRLEEIGKSILGHKVIKGSSNKLLD